MENPAPSTPVHEAGPPEDVADLRGFMPAFVGTQFLGILAMILVGIWTGSYCGGFAWQSDPKLQFNYHPLLMIIGMVYFYSNAIMIYRVSRNERKRKLKFAHMILHILAFVCVVVSLKAVFDSHDLASPPIPNLYSLHSWIGLITVILFCLQFVGGFVTFLYPGLKSTIRAAAMPVHIFFGLGIFLMAVGTCIMGITEKIFFRIGKPPADAIPYSSYAPEGILVNFLGLILVILAVVVTFIVVNPRYRRRPLPEDELLLLNPTGN